ncbi:MAG: hypothetical protein ABTQ34_07670 [Bdellovibrionales bacterium]
MMNPSFDKCARPKERDIGILFGRFQPLSHGQVELIRAIEKVYGVAPHVVMNEKEDIANERNPYNRAERREMFRLALPDYGEDLLRFTTVYLDRGGDVADGVRALSSVFSGIAAPERITIFYVNKAEDVKTYRVDGRDYPGLHYTDLFLPPFGGFAKQEISPKDIAALPQELTASLRAYVEGLRPNISATPLGEVAMSARRRGAGPPGANGPTGLIF